MYVRCNQVTIVNKNLRNAIMTRSRLLNKFRQDRTISSHVAYKKQWNICVKLRRKTEKQFFDNLDVKRVTDNKQFWKTVKPSLTDKTLKGKRITLTENEKVVSDKRELVKVFNEYFSNLPPNLRYSTPFNYNPSPWPGVKCNKKI